MSWVSVLLLQPCNTHENKHEQNSTLNKRKTLGVRKVTWKKWWQQWWKRIGWQVGLYSHTTIIKYELPQHENRAWWTPKTSIEDEHELYKRRTWPKKKKRQQKGHGEQVHLKKMITITSCIVLLLLHSALQSGTCCCYYMLLHIVAIAHCTLLLIFSTTSYCCCMLAAFLWVVAHYGLHKRNQIWIYINY